MTNQDKVLRAAFEVSGSGKRTFTAGQLAVEAWNQHPNEFGLANFSMSHPDVTKVMATVLGRDGLLMKGMIACENKQYSVTKKGKERAEEIVKGSAPVEQGLSKECDALLRRLLFEPAYVKLASNQSDKLTRDNALDWYGIDEYGGDAAAGLKIDAHDRLLNELDVVVDRLNTLAVGEVLVQGATVRFIKNVGSVCDRKIQRLIDRIRG